MRCHPRGDGGGAHRGKDPLQFPGDVRDQAGSSYVRERGTGCPDVGEQVGKLWDANCFYVLPSFYLCNIFNVQFKNRDFLFFLSEI